MTTTAVTFRSTSISWEERLRRLAVLIGRLGLAYLFFSQLFWKLPPDFGCLRDGHFAYTTVDTAGKIVRGQGLCDWLGTQSIFAQRDRTFFVTEFPNNHIGLGLGPLVQLNGAFVDNVVIPNIGFFGWLIWLTEAFIAVSMLLGLFSRLGALVAIGISVQLMLGLAGVWDSMAGLQEWEWAYHTIILLAVLMFGLAPGRIFGLDAVMRPRLLTAAQGGRSLARVLLWFT